MVNKFTTNCFRVAGNEINLTQWLEAFKDLGFKSYKRTAWDPGSLKKEGKRHFRGHGWQVDKIQMQGGQAGLLLNPAYPIFDKLDGAPLAITSPGLSNPATKKPMTWEEVQEIKEKLMKVSGEALTNMTGSLIFDPGTNIKRIYQNNESYTIKSQINSNDRPFYKPVSISLIATGYNPTPHKTVIVEAAKELQETLQRRGCNCTLSFELPKSNKIFGKIKRIYQNGFTPMVFLGLKGSHGDTLPEEILVLITELEKSKIPFQIFSYKNWTKFNAYSICSSVCLKAGGLPFRVSGSKILDSYKPIIVGLDKSHNREKRTSNYSMVILSSDGNILYKDKWLTKLDETFRDVDTKKATLILRNFLTNTKLGDRGIIVMRDGRMFKNESLEPWQNLHKNDNLTYLEIIKNPTPIIYGSNEQLSPLISFGKSSDGFLCPKWDRRNGLGKTRRIRIRKNPNNYTIEQIAEMLAVTSYQPRLGPHPTLHPSPIYWADGFAGTSDKQLQFRGFS